MIYRLKTLHGNQKSRNDLLIFLMIIKLEHKNSERHGNTNSNAFTGLDSHWKDTSSPGQLDSFLQTLNSFPVKFTSYNFTLPLCQRSEVYSFVPWCSTSIQNLRHNISNRGYAISKPIGLCKDKITHAKLTCHPGSGWRAAAAMELAFPWEANGLEEEEKTRENKKLPPSQLLILRTI